MRTTATMDAPPDQGHDLDPEPSSAARDRLRHVIEHASHLLPAQGPITVFIHHNTLHAFEDLPFTEAVQKGARVFGCEPFLSEERFRRELVRGRIRFVDLEAVLHDDLGDRGAAQVFGPVTRLELRTAMLQYPLRTASKQELLWFVAETDALRKVSADASTPARVRLLAETRRWVMRDLRGGNEESRDGATGPARRGNGLAALLERFGDSAIEGWTDATWEAFTLQALWRLCCDGVANVPEFALPPPPAIRHRDLFWQAVGQDPDSLVHGLLIRFCGAFIDQGLAHWELPRRAEGFLAAFCALYRTPAGPAEPWMRGLGTELARLQDERISPLQSVCESLEALGVEEREWDDYLSATLLALRGWGGIIRFLEERGDRAVRPIPQGSLVEFLAVRLLLDRLALAYQAREAFDFVGPLSDLRDELRRRIAPPAAASVEERAFLLFQVCQALGRTPEDLHRLDADGWYRLVDEVENFTGLERRRLFHLAYERRFYTQTLDAVSLHARNPFPEPKSPSFQAVFCIDEREESIRRHLEEVAPECATLSMAGFYAVAMYYRGADDAHCVPLCPAIMLPKHWVTEKVIEDRGGAFERRTRRLRVLGRASHQMHLGTRSFALGALLSAVGVFASIPLVMRTLFPRLTAQLRGACGRIVATAPRTRLQIERTATDPGPHGDAVGYSLDEMVAIAHRVLGDLGLTAGCSRLVLLFGHGSTSMNNPHESAHDCGACGGARGGANGRAMAHILNDPRVRERLRVRGITIPATTAFVGGMHNTSNEVATFYDLDALPESHRAEFAAARALIEEACDRDAHERCRRFGSAPLTLSYKAARLHAEGRAEDLAQVRPEWGHASNAICIVGRRERTRGLFLDRRAFLNTYDPTTDDADAKILTRILQAAVPVCAGINLEYYFSYVDNPGFGSGSKLPHNITALLGVMDGAASDLRTGLPWQMVEIHEPVRLLFIIEARPETVLQIMDRNPAIGQMIRNGWVQVAMLDPESSAIQFFQGGAFRDYRPQAERLPQASASVDWYRGWRDHLEFAQIGLRGPG